MQPWKHGLASMIQVLGMGKGAPNGPQFKTTILADCDPALFKQAIVCFAPLYRNTCTKKRRLIKCKPLHPFAMDFLQTSTKSRPAERPHDVMPLFVKYLTNPFDAESPHPLAYPSRFIRMRWA